MVPNGWDVAREAGVSQTTVSRTLRGDPLVASATREHVLDVARRLGYTPNTAARTLITNRTNTVAVVVPDISHPLYPEETATIHAELSAAGYRMMLFSQGLGDSGPQDLEALRGNTVDGIVFAAATVDSPAVAEFLGNGMPLVLLNRDVDHVDVDRVLADDRAACDRVAQYLVDLGHRRIALISGRPDTSAGRDRTEFFGQALDRLGCPLDPELVRSGHLSHARGYTAAEELLDRDPAPTAVLCTSDIVAYGVLDAANRRGVRVPDDLSVLGFDDLTMSGWSMIGLTTVHQPLDEMARAAVRTLLDRIEHGADHVCQRKIFDVELVERRTAGPTPD
ncbi:LacI family DNA-binding transcriptional regulator [Haloactinomyces albus]|uniref:LacI family transcriptional regulator n=1 Tax=Haloactinomyces albus TaxID=1352928 RepID=A0AAE3ZAL4_9ACTN|nr:LacI family DNA-binding transcriptional regulator [Haloactinomyces albus]MDR7300203.1 LacI family transcriptional regulator [Haloactinomyces albus]